MKIKVAKPDLGEEEIQAVREVLLSGNLVSGKKVKEFEREFAKYIGTNHAVAVNSGTAALILALQAAGVGVGDEVIVPPITFFSTISAVLYCNAKPVFVDVMEDDLTLNPHRTKEAYSIRTRAIIPVHLYGGIADTLYGGMSPCVIEDCAQAHGSNLYPEESLYPSRKVGAIGDFGCFSFFATKHMTTGGEGGMVTTDHRQTADEIRSMRSHGMTDRDTHKYLSYNYRMTEMQAAIGLVQLKKLDDMNAKRVRNSYIIMEELKSKFRFFVADKGQYHTFFWLPMEADEKLKGYLTKHEIEFRHRYKEPLWKQPVMNSDMYINTGCPVAEKYAGWVIGLPNHHQMTEQEISYVIETLKRY